MKKTTRPLLVIDGDSFAHRAYHGLPKTIKRSGGGGAGAIVGFANYLIRLYEAERPRAVVVGWDTLDAPTYRHRALPDYQSGRHFDRDLLEQLELLPRFVEACGFTAAKAPGYEADDFLAAAVAREEKRRGIALVATGDRDAFQLVSERTTVLFPVRAGQMDRVDPAGVRTRYGVEPEQVPDFIALRGDPSDRIPGIRGVGHRVQPQSCAGTERWKRRLPRGDLPRRRRRCGSIARWRRWTLPRRCPASPIAARPGQQRPSSPGSGDLA